MAVALSYIKMDIYLLHHLIYSVFGVIPCREIVDHPYITDIPANSFRGITSNVLTA